MLIEEWKKRIAILGEFILVKFLQEKAITGLAFAIIAITLLALILIICF